MKIYSIDKGEMPPENKYILIHFRYAPFSSDDIEGAKWQVAQFNRGISIKEREILECQNNPRANIYRYCDEHGNNHRPYAFDLIGPGTEFGQSVDYWCELPTAFGR